MLEVRLLGSFEVKRNDEIVAISSRPAQSLFAYLILTAGTYHRREKLAGMLWPDSMEDNARDYLRRGLKNPPAHSLSSTIPYSPAPTSRQCRALILLSSID
jgi:DNA-binding winged helix-turn-helix (wHTH) protein